MAFGKVGRYPFRACVPEDPDGDPYALICNRFGKRKPVKRFTDAEDLVSRDSRTGRISIRRRPLFFRDVDASTVVPSQGQRDLLDPDRRSDGVLLPALYGTDIGGGHVLGTGNPADGRPAIDGGDPGTTADLSLGVKVRVLKVGKGNKRVQITVKPGHKASPAPTLAKTGSR